MTVHDPDEIRGLRESLAKDNGAVRRRKALERLNGRNALPVSSPAEDEVAVLEFESDRYSFSIVRMVEMKCDECETKTHHRKTTWSNGPESGGGAVCMRCKHTTKDWDTF